MADTALNTTFASAAAATSSLTSAFSVAALSGGPPGWLILGAGTLLSLLSLRLGGKAIFKGTGRPKEPGAAPSPA